MAAVDLYGGDAQRIRSQYQTSLGRDASDDEVSGWLSGSYGGGGIDQYLQQISGSHEAQQRLPQRDTPQVVSQPSPNVSGPMTVPTNPNSGQPDYSQWYPQVDAWYQQYLGRQGSGAEMENWLSGQFGHGDYRNLDAIRNAIAGSGEARQRQPQTSYGGQPQAQSGPAPQGGNYQSWFMGLTGGKPPSPQSLKALEPVLAQYGIRLGPLNARGFTDGIILPNGQFVDVIRAATETGGDGWDWIIGGGHGGVGGGQLPGNQFSDQYTQLLEQLIKSRLGVLQGGIQDPMRQQLMGAYQNRANQLGSAAEPGYQQLLQRLESRFKDLQGPGYTGAENEAIRTGALDPIEQDRAAAKKRVMEQLSARGLDLNSGIAQHALMEVDKAFDGMRASTQTVLTTNDLNRRESRAQRADSIRGSLYDIPQARAREQLDVFGAMDVLESVMRQEEEARSREAIGYGGALADLGPQRMQLAMQAAGMGGNPLSMFQSLMQMAQLNQNAALLNQRNSGQLWSGLGSLAYSLMNAGR